MAAKRPKQMKSLQALADLVGLSKSAVRKWTHDPRWIWSRLGPWSAKDVRLILGWRAMYKGHDPAAAYRESLGGMAFAKNRPLTDMEERKLQYLTVRAKLLYQRLQVEEGKLHRTDVCLHLYAGMVHKAKSAMLAVARSLRNALTQQDGDTVERIVHERMLAILKDLEPQKP